MLLLGTVYVFSIILAVFLVGLAIGSAAASSLLKSIRNPRLAFGWCQFLLTLAIAWTAYMIADALPYLPVNPLISTNPWYTFQLDIMRCLWTILPPTILFGASFPLALASVAKPDQLIYILAYKDAAARFEKEILSVEVPMYSCKSLVTL